MATSRHVAPITAMYASCPHNGFANLGTASFHAMAQTLSWDERLHHRDQLRAARYAALADAEGFHEVCYALEALGLRLAQRKAHLGRYREPIAALATQSIVLSDLSGRFPDRFGTFESLYEQVRVARNDAMHTGAYARHATSAAIELCIGLEEALMKEQQLPRSKVKDYMVKQPVSVEPWQPVAHARQLMLTHSFSFVPVFTDSWKLVSETSMAKYLLGREDWSARLAMPISEAVAHGLVLLDARVVNIAAEVQTLVAAIDPTKEPLTLWLVVDGHERLTGVLSPFELM